MADRAIDFNVVIGSKSDNIESKALFNGGLEIRVSEFRGAISSKIRGYEPCDFF